MEMLNDSFMGKPLYAWIIFFAVVFGLLIFDLGVLSKKLKEIGFKQSIFLSLFYILIGTSYSIWIYYMGGLESAENYLTGYLIEKSLSLDNIFVISLIFSYFKVPPQYQHRVLFWGILGVLILRGMMISLGAILIHQFEWVLYVFAIFLVLTGLKMLFIKETDFNVQNNPLFKLLSARLRITPTLHGEKFIVRLKDEAGKKQIWATPLLLTLVLIESADLIFAIDSVPAIFSIMTDPYIVYTSNIFAILGLRALYFALSAAITQFHYLKYALALILIFIGIKVLIHWIIPAIAISSSLSLGITISLLIGGIVVSLLKPQETLK